jgi:hypothetical protein
MNQATVNHSHKYCDYHQSNQRDRDNGQSDYRYQDDWHHDHPRRNDKDMWNNKSYDKKDNCKRDHLKKKSDEAMRNDQSSSAGDLSEQRSQSCSRSPSRSCSRSWSRSCSSSRSYSNHHVEHDNRKPSAAPKQWYSPKHRYSYSKDNDDEHIHHPGKSDTVFATFSALMKKKKRTQN